MKKQIKQILYDMRTQPLIAWVTVIGTALSIFLIMTVVMIESVGVMSFSPNRTATECFTACMST